ncbi:MAG: PHP domain-containing protein [Candidatus Omnitrophica bacterium]|nr:PHP domain-containing protein [Candidatus Omnitrophota bacterium]
MTKWADLHIHTYYSDSTSSPEEVVEDAVKAGLSCIAITDHDVIDGIEPVRAAAKAHDIEVIAGIELSSELNGKDIHILGYGFDCTRGPLFEKLGAIQQARIDRIKVMIEKLKGLGVNNITFEEVAAKTKSNAVGRPHLAAVLHEKGWVNSVRSAFDKYIGEGGPAYYTKYNQTPFEAIKLITDSGGVAVMAHPMLTQKDELISQFVKSGMEGLEVYYPHCSETVLKFYKNIAKKYNILTTGGSDAHGKAKTHTYVGKTQIPYELVEALKEKFRRI